jgi:PAS domain S-box-containing protein
LTPISASAALACTYDYRVAALSVSSTHSTMHSIGIVGIGVAAFATVALWTSFIARRFSAQSLALRHCEQRYRELVASAKVTLWRASLDATRFSQVNQEAENLLGYPIQEWVSTPGFWIDHLHPEDRAAAAACCWAVVENRVPGRFEHRMIAADGRVVWLRTSVHLVSDHGKAEELAGVMLDITDRKLAAEAAAEASRTKSGLLAETTVSPNN